MLPIILQLLPMILELLKKDQNQRGEAAKMGVVMQRAAMKADDWMGIFAGGVIQRLGSMTDDQQAVIEGAVQGAIAVQEVQAAAKGGAV